MHDSWDEEKKVTEEEIDKNILIIMSEKHLGNTMRNANEISSRVENW